MGIIRFEVTQIVRTDLDFICPFRWKKHFTVNEMTLEFIFEKGSHYKFSINNVLQKREKINDYFNITQKVTTFNIFFC